MSVVVSLEVDDEVTSLTTIVQYQIMQKIAQIVNCFVLI